MDKRNKKKFTNDESESNEELDEGGEDPECIFDSTSDRKWANNKNSNKSVGTTNLYKYIY